ncbi:MoxR family ATPase [Nakamurella flava]|uniref:MoxR family ATPase n=1 Tax=Nakamurella flava TaxID=2576308 RepID=A0A4U6QMT7_9ACTN|nr:MoxR family ATPase [Nakamurella flava]TKV62007.1 MoxR family ATPase [Nakamurella flava]
MSTFASVDEVSAALAEHGYIPDRRVATTVFLMLQLDRPALLEGPAGVGKTELAKAISAITGRRLVRLQCYEGQDETKALYDWDYGKQLLYTQLLRDKIGEIVSDAPDLESAVDLLSQHDSVFFSERFLAPRPLFEAINGQEPAVLLIDEIDRADEALEAVLLETLGEYQISIPEIGRFEARTAPLVLLTSNNTRDLSAALKRRCLHLFLDYPDADRELEILRSKQTGLSDALAAQLVQVVRGLRDLELRKAPSISETIDWARTLAVLGATELDAKVLADTVSVVVKYERDHARAIKALPTLIDPNAVVPDHRPDHSHGHGHSHSHGGHTHSHDDGDHDHSHDDHDHSHGHPKDEVGVARRAEKDKPGRHGPGHYGTPPYAAGDDDLVPEVLPKTAVGPDRGKRSFAAGLGRRRAI